MVNRLKAYWLKNVSIDAAKIQSRFGTAEATTRKMVTVAFLATLSAIFQSMGGFLPGIGFLISPLATAPTVLSAVISVGSGLTAYVLTIILLFIIQPSELIIFPFTTGLLGLGIGWSLVYLRTRIFAVITGALSLWTGILLLLYVFRFPVLGPAATSAFNWNTMVFVYVFAFFYSWLWVEISKYFIWKVSRVQ